MKKIIVLAIGLATALPFAISQNSTVSLDLDQFDKFELSVNATLEVSEGPRQSVSITGPQSLINEVNTDIEDGNWEIEYPDHMKREKHPALIIKIVVQSLRGLAVSGTGKIKAIGRFSKVPKRNIALSGTGEIEFKGGDADHTQIALSGSGNMDIEASGDVISCALSGSGDIDLNGTTKDLKLVTSGSGNVGGDRLKTDHLKLIISGSSIITAHVVKSAEMTVSGSGMLNYRGNPKITKKHSSGSSCAKKIGDR